MAPSKIDKKRKDKDKNASKSDTEESLKTRNKNLCCVPKGTEFSRYLSSLVVFWRHRGLPQPRDTGLEQRQQGHLQQQQVQPVRLYARRVLQVSCPGVCTTNQKDIFIIKFLTFLHSTFESIQALVFLSQQIRGCSGQLHVQVWARSYLEWQAALREHVEDLRLRHRLQEVRLWLRPRISEERSGLCSRDLS